MTHGLAFLSGDILRMPDNRILTHPVSRVIMGVLWGLAISLLFQRTCEGNNCRISEIRGPDPNWVQRHVFHTGNPESGCYRFRAVIMPCSQD